MGCESPGAQQPNAAGAGVTDKTTVTNVFEPPLAHRQRRSSLFACRTQLGREHGLAALAHGLILVATLDATAGLDSRPLLPRTLDELPDHFPQLFIPAGPLLTGGQEQGAGGYLRPFGFDLNMGERSRAQLCHWPRSAAHDDEGHCGSPSSDAPYGRALPPCRQPCEQPRVRVRCRGMRGIRALQATEVALGIAPSARGRRTAAILPARSSLCWARLRSGCRRPKSPRSTTADGLVAGSGRRS